MRRFYVLVNHRWHKATRSGCDTVYCKATNLNYLIDSEEVKMIIS